MVRETDRGVQRELVEKGRGDEFETAETCKTASEDRP